MLYIVPKLGTLLFIIKRRKEWHISPLQKGEPFENDPSLDDLPF